MTAAFSLYRRLLHYARPYGWRLALGILCGMAAGGSWLGIFQFAGDLLEPFQKERPGAAAIEAPADQAPADQAPADQASTQTTGFQQRLADRFNLTTVRPDGSLTGQFVLLTVIGLTLVAALKALVTYVNRYYMQWVGARIVRDLRDDLFGCLQRQSLAFYGTCNVGNLISRCTNDMVIVEGVVSKTVADLTRAPVEIVVAVSFILYVALRGGFLGLLLGMAVLFPLIIVPIVLIGQRVKRHTSGALQRIGDLVSRMQENFTGIRVVKAYNMEDDELARFRAMNRQYFRKSIKALRAELLMTPLTEAVAITAAGAGLLFCYFRGIPLSGIGPIALAGSVAYRPMKQLAKVNVSLQRCNAAAERIFALLDTDTALPEAENPVRIAEFADAVVFEGVGFRYSRDEPAVLTDIGFELRKGRVIAFVGQTGSGKTTVANLLARFYDPTEGRVTLDGHDLRDIETAALRRLIGIVTQETILFNDTVANNIAYGSKDAAHEQIVEAAKKANAHEFIEANPGGYQRIVGEKGFVLSGGQRQRIAIARAILKNPPILILDEATSALDTVTERLVQEALSRLMQNRTVFAIAHRLSTVKHADQIYVLDNGRIVEHGTHDELIAHNGMYRELSEMQFS